MAKLPENVMKVINDPKASKVLATKYPTGVIHVIHVGSIIAPNPNTIAFAAVLMKETSKNLEEMKKKGELASILVILGMEAYQIRVNIKSYETSGPIYDKLSEEIKKLGLQVRGVWITEPVEIWNQSASYEAGKRIA
ncbi:MAG: hypothetical protein QXL52_06335 [Nitrososphaerales archaeon]